MLVQLLVTAACAPLRIPVRIDRCAVDVQFVPLVKQLPPVGEGSCNHTAERSVVGIGAVILVIVLVIGRVTDGRTVVGAGIGPGELGLFGIGRLPWLFGIHIRLLDVAPCNGVTLAAASDRKQALFYERQKLCAGLVLGTNDPA